jgi:Flp pilus assembly protein TadG
MRSALSSSIVGRFRAFASNTRGGSAAEFAIVAAPFVLVLLAILQIGIYYMYQAALDTGVIKEADALHSAFTTGTFAAPSDAAVKQNVATFAGGLIANNSTLAVNVAPLSTLSSSIVPITDGGDSWGSPSTDGTAGTTLVIRAQSNALVFAPGFSSLSTVTSTAIVRRQGT